MPEERSKWRVFVVDDDDSIRRVMQVILRKGGIETTSFSNGREALAAVRENPPDAILLDLMMEGMTGEEVLEAIRSDPHLHAVRVIVVSAKNDLTSVKEVSVLGADGYLLKPFTPGKVLEKVRAVLTARPLHRAVRTSGSLALCPGPDPAYEAVAEILGRRHELQVERDGPGMIRAVTSRARDAILLAHDGPVLGGIGFLRKFRELPETRDVPVFLFDVPEENRPSCYELECDDILPIDGDPERILRRIDDVLTAGRVQVTRDPGGWILRVRRVLSGRIVDTIARLARDLAADEAPIAVDLTPIPAWAAPLDRAYLRAVAELRSSGVDLRTASISDPLRRVLDAEVPLFASTKSALA